MARKFLGMTFGQATPTPPKLNNYQTFGTPFGIVGKGDITKPYISGNYLGSTGYVRFGTDNLYPQLINQMYYTSPLNGAIIDLKTNAVIGGGFEIENSAVGGREKVEEYTFLKKNKLKRVIKTITKNYVMHGRALVIIHFDENSIPMHFELLPPEKARINRFKNEVSISEDWSMGVTHEILKVYNPMCGDRRQVLILEEDSPGQDWYPLPAYTSSFNWMFLDGETSHLQKQNIQNAIFPSFGIMFPTVPEGADAIEAMEHTITKMKGAYNAGDVFVVAANGKEQLPEIVPIPTNQNDKLFIETSKELKDQICFAHSINPSLVGIKVAGSLGNTQEIEASYKIFEKNFIMPTRAEIEDFINEIMMIFKVSGDFKINDFQIIGDIITQVN